jgi:exonuclease III
VGRSSPWEIADFHLAVASAATPTGETIETNLSLSEIFEIHASLKLVPSLGAVAGEFDNRKGEPIMKPIKSPLRAAWRVLVAAVLCSGHAVLADSPNKPSPVDQPPASKLPAVADHPEVIRALHWNVWMYPDIVHPDAAGLDNDHRVPHIVGRLNKQKYDIVSINELFSGSPDQKGQYDEFIYLMTGIDPGVSDIGNTDISYSYLPHGAPPAQYPYYAWSPGFHMKTVGDAGLGLFTQFPPLPRNDLHPAFMELPGEPYPQGISVDYYCLNPEGTAKLASFQSRKVKTYLNPMFAPVWASSPPWYKTNMNQTSGCAAAYTWYLEADGADAGAVKGILWTRVQNTKTGRPLNIFVTHTQADYPEANPPEEYSAVRATQLQHLRNFINSMAYADEDVMVMGDLNVLGDGKKFIGVTPSQNQYEYKDWISDIFVAQDGFEDVYRAQMKTTDNDGGFTRHPIWNGHDAADPYPQRLDYILTRWQSDWDRSGYCMQHARARRDFNLYLGGSKPATDASDHFPVEMAVSFDSGYCAPRKALDAGNSANLNTTRVLTFDNPGAVQWIRVPADTDLAITAEELTHVDGSKHELDVTAFLSTDLSMPVETFNKRYRLGFGKRDLKKAVKVSFPVPAYLRITPASYGAIGTAEVMITKMDGLTPDTALLIGASGFLDVEKSHARYSENWSKSWSEPTDMPGTSLNGTPGQKVKWFEFNNQPGADGKGSCFTLRILQGGIQPPAASGNSSFRIRVQQGNTVYQNWGNYVPTNVGSSAKPFQAVFDCSANPGLAVPTGAEIKLGIERLDNANNETLRLVLTPDVRSYRFIDVGIAQQGDWGWFTGGDEAVGRFYLDDVVAWNVKTTDRHTDFSGWNLHFPIWGQGATGLVNKAYFRTHIGWELGEESCDCAADTWNPNEIEWFRVYKNGNHYGRSVDFHPVPWGVQVKSGDTQVETLYFNRFSASKVYQTGFWDPDGPDEGEYYLNAELGMPNGLSAVPNE